MTGAGSLAHNRRDFIAENVNPNRVYLNICYRDENLKNVYQAIRTIANEVLYSIAISASGLKNRKKQKGKEFEMRIVDNFGRRYKWSKTEITCSLETMELVFQDKVEKRTLYIDEYKNGSKVEYVGP